MRQSPAACILLPDTVRIAFSVQVFLLEKVHFPVFHKAFEYCPRETPSSRVFPNSKSSILAKIVFKAVPTISSLWRVYAVIVARAVAA